MNLGILKVRLYELIKEYFQGAEVIWSGQKGAKPVLPLVTLDITSVEQATFPIEEFDDGSPVNYFLSQARLEVQLFTKGTVPTGGSFLANSDNTAVHDLADLLRFMTSYYAIDWMAEQNINIQAEGPIQEISALLNNVQKENRAMQEFVVNYIQEAREFTGIAPPQGEPWRPTASGGGTQALAEKQSGWGDRMEITEETGGNPQ